MSCWIQSASQQLKQNLTSPASKISHTLSCSSVLFPNSPHWLCLLEQCLVTSGALGLSL